jgi:hypothetical protein
MDEYDNKKKESEQQAVNNDTSQKNTEETDTEVQDNSAEAVEMREFESNIENTEEEGQEQAAISGNAGGAEALTKMADMLDALLTDEQTAELGLTDEEKLHFQEITAGARNYAAKNKAMLVDDLTKVSAEVAHHLGSGVATYSVTDDFIYLLSGPDNHDALNTIVHEVSHALSKDSPDTTMLLTLNPEHSQLEDKEGEPGKKEYTTPEEQLLGLDFNLSLARVELKGEIDGEIAENISKNEEDHKNNYRIPIEAWRSGKYRGGSAQAALDEWDKIINEVSKETSLLQLKQPDYNEAAEQYLIGDRDFPVAKKYRL